MPKRESDAIVVVPPRRTRPDEEPGLHPRYPEPLPANPNTWRGCRYDAALISWGLAARPNISRFSTVTGGFKDNLASRGRNKYPEPPRPTKTADPRGTRLPLRRKRVSREPVPSNRAVDVLVTVS